ncbi:MAG: hypothetical protein ABSB15_06930 [Bryobacteraceae bacterium]|jgi:hypothetical protein
MKRISGQVALGLSLVIVSLRAGVPLEEVHGVTIDRVDFAPGGAANRILASTGEPNIRGWDQPQVGITVTRSAWCAGTPAAREKTTRKLNLTTVSHEKKGAAELVPSTLHKRSATIHLDYRIMVPRTSHLVVDRRTGDVVVDNVDGGINAHAHEGDILFPSTSQYA